MKCIQFPSGHIERVDDDKAFELEKSKKIVFVPKNQWKKQKAATEDA
jgi:hypothetical protein